MMASWSSERLEFSVRGRDLGSTVAEAQRRVAELEGDLAATRARTTDPVALKAFILSPEFQVAGFKGQKLTVRDWDHQLRQPILLTTGLLMASVSPQDAYLHQVTALDTLGIDRPETQCKF